MVKYLSEFIGFYVVRHKIKKTADVVELYLVGGEGHKRIEKVENTYTESDKLQAAIDTVMKDNVWEDRDNFVFAENGSRLRDFEWVVVNRNTTPDYVLKKFHIKRTESGEMGPE